MSSDDHDRTIATTGGPGATEASEGDEAFCPQCGASYPVETSTCTRDGARLAKLRSQPDSLLGRVFEGRYEVRMALGQGGMGTVYRGLQISVDREVAIKVIHPKLATDRVVVKRFLREARLASRLSQPSVVNVYDFGQSDDGILFLVMELLRGHTLARELEAQRPLPLKRVATIGLQLCDALDAAHAQGIIHRDLKPGNIVILDDPPGRDLIKVLDFGLAKSLVADTSSIVTRTDAILGTPLYMAPEQIDGKPSDQRGDLYALGCILFQMVSGRPPFVSQSVNLLLAMHLSDPVPPLPLGVPGPLVDMIERLLAKDPAQRIASAREVRELIQSVLEAGLYGNDMSDTTPDIPAMTLPTAPLAFAETEHGATTGTALVAGPRRGARMWLLAAVLVAAAAAVSFAVVNATRTRAAAAPPDAAAPVIAPALVPDATVPDAAVPDAVAMPDAAVPDATAAPARDARPPRRPRLPRPDAGVDDLPFIKP